MAQFARQFTRPDDEVITSLGNVGKWGDSSIAAIVRTADVTNTKVVISAGGGPAWTFQVDADESVAFFSDGGGGVKRNSAASRIIANTWHLIGCTKVTGTTTPRFHIYRYDLRTWVHEDGGGTQSDTAGPPAGAATVWICQDNNSSGAGWSGQCQIGAYWTGRVLTDADFEALTDTRLAWDASTPSALWPLTQQTTATAVADVTGGGANQTVLTGTSVVIGNPDFDASVADTFSPIPLMK